MRSRSSRYWRFFFGGLLFVGIALGCSPGRAGLFDTKARDQHPETGDDPSAIPLSSLTLVSASAPGAEVVLDGDDDTRWYLDSFPQEIVLGLSGTWVVAGLRYSSGHWTRAGAYEVYVTTDVTDWGSPVASGSALPDELVFPAKTGAFVKLRLLGGRGGSRYGYVAGLDVLHDDVTPDTTPDTTPGTALYVDSALSGACAGSYSVSNRSCTGADGSAFTNLASIIPTLKAGDTVYLRAGRYAGFKLENVNGSSNDWITLKPYRGEAVTIDSALGAGCAPTGSCAIYISGASYVSLENLEVTNGRFQSNSCGAFDIGCQNDHRPCNPENDSACGAYYASTWGGYQDQNGIYIAGANGNPTPSHDVTLKNLNIHHLGGIGIVEGDQTAAWGPEGGLARLQILNSEIHHLGIRGFNQAYCTYLYGTGHTIRGNSCHDNAGSDGMRLGYSGTDDHDFFNNSVVENNVFFNNGGVIWRASSDQWIHGGNGLTLLGGYNNLISNNVAYGNRGFGFFIYGMGAQNNKVYNNTAYGNGQPGFYAYSPCVGCAGDQSAFTNNIAYKNDIAPTTYSPVTGSNYCGSAPCNYYVESGAVPVTSYNLGFSDTTDPAFVSASTGDFHVQSWSPAIRAGTSLWEVPTDFDGRRRGSSPSIGAFE